MSGTSDRVASFAVDHRTLRAGVYERARKYGTISWDVRLVAPSEHRPLTPGAMHVLEHCLAEWLREGELEVIAVCPMGCLTGLYVVTPERVSREELTKALFMAFSRFPILREDIPGMNEIQCGNPELCDVAGANVSAMEFCKTLISENYV